jgi:hypothetical protein
MVDMPAQGYIEAEYFISGVATRYRLAEGTSQDRSGHWQAESVGTAAYKTRMLVYRPANAADFNGTVVLTWNNVTAGHDLFQADSKELLESGAAMVFVTTQKAGIEGLPPVNQGLANWDPERYPDLEICSDDYSFDIFSQTAEAVGPKRQSDGIDPLAGLEVQRVIAAGASQSAGRLATFINAVAPIHNPIDGFVLQIYFGRGTALEVGDTVVNINTPQQGKAADRLQGENLLRDDLGVPIFVVNSELEASACYAVRQPDTDTLRYWEVAGTSHTSLQGREIRQRILDRDQLVSRKVEPKINAIPISPVYDAVYHHMQRWLTDGVAPPVQPRINFTGNPPLTERDELGIATGGIRLPQAEVPLAVNSAIPLGDDIFALLGGSCAPFSKEQVLALYADKAEFLGRFVKAGEAAVAQGVMLPRVLDALVQEASETWDNIVGE